MNFSKCSACILLIGVCACEQVEPPAPLTVCDGALCVAHPIFQLPLDHVPSSAETVDGLGSWTSWLASGEVRPRAGIAPSPANDIVVGDVRIRVDIR